jgi:hypothetical protein
MTADKLKHNNGPVRYGYFEAALNSVQRPAIL